MDQDIKQIRARMKLKPNRKINILDLEFQVLLELIREKKNESAFDVFKNRAEFIQIFK
jgi:hypothetical protein